MNEHTLMDVVERMRNRFFGKYRGTVTDVNDDGRIRALVPAVLGRRQKTGWCMPCVPYAGDQCGLAFLPEPGTGVWIEFEGGDVAYPIWVGAYWYRGKQPRELKQKVKVIRTNGQQRIIFDDEHGSITVQDKNNNKIILDGTGITVVRDKGKIEISNKLVKVNDDGMVVT